MIEIKDVSKIYHVGNEEIEALSGVSLSIKEGEFVAIVGPSGSGKSTLLHLIAGLDKPSYGEVVVQKKNLALTPDSVLSKYRNRTIGFIFQEFHLLQHLSILENVKVPLMFASHEEKASHQKKATELLEDLHLGDRLNHRPNEISGGQKQRVAIARALINAPKIILADEPTGNLDSVTGKAIIDLLKKVHKQKKLTLIIVTHDKEIAKAAQRVIEIKDGKLVTKNRPTRFTN
ncbi:ABC transporter ATP-binding protein [Candidatus Peregrinibacteria bacterium]|nr:ABC transporter ATP-binding protein [Candidatus Peregrinibacteria bacterium]